MSEASSSKSLDYFEREMGRILEKLVKYEKDIEGKISSITDKCKGLTEEISKMDNIYKEGNADQTPH